MNILAKAEKLFEAQDFKAALEEFKKIVDENPNDAIAYQRMAQCNDRLGNHDDAMQAAKKALEIDPELSVPHIILAFAYHRNSLDDESLAEALAAYKLSPESADSLHCYGTILTTQGRLEEGIQLLEKARALEPNRLSVRNNLAIAYIWAKDYNKYWEEAKFLFKHNPSMKYSIKLLDAFQRKHALAFTILSILAVFCALLFKMKLLLLCPAIPTMKGLLNSYHLFKQRKLRIASTEFIAYMLLAIFLGLIYSLITG